MVTQELCAQFVAILQEELVPAMGCTEPISIAYAAAKARQTLGDKPVCAKLEVSGNIVKNAKSVTVPHTGGLRGIRSAFIAGLVAGNADAQLEVLSSVTAEEIEEIKRVQETFAVEIVTPENARTFDIAVTLQSQTSEVFVRIADTHTNIVCVKKDHKTLFEKPLADTSKKTDRSALTVENIYEFAQTVDTAQVQEILERQIAYNMAIAEEGLKNDYGANVGKVLMRSYQPDIKITAKAYAAAASDARMNGCELPVIINSGSGNQGITASVPVIVYARGLQLPKDKLYRALCVSNLVTVHLKEGIGTLSAYCGVVSAGGGCGLRGGVFARRYEKRTRAHARQRACD